MALILTLVLGCAPEPCGEGIVCTVAGAEMSGFNGEGLPAVESWLYLPSGLALDPDGRPCVVDFNNLRVRCLDAGRLETVAGNGLHETAIPGLSMVETPLDNPIDAQWHEGRLAVLPAHESRLVAEDEDGAVIVLAGSGEEGYSGDGGPATEAAFAQPCGFTFAGDGSVWIADTQNGAVRRIDADGLVATVLSGLPGVQRVRPGEGDHVLVADTYGGRVLDVSPAGEVEVLAEGFLYPWSATLAWDGAVYVTSSGEHRVYRVRDGETELVAGTGEGGFSGDGGRAIDARLSWPADTLLLDDGTLLVADMQNGRVRSIGGVATP